MDTKSVLFLITIILKSLLSPMHMIKADLNKESVESVNIGVASQVVQDKVFARFYNVYNEIITKL